MSFHYYIIALLIGIILGALLYFLFLNKIKYRGPDSNIIRKKIYKVDNKCYKFKPTIYMCPN